MNMKKRNVKRKLFADVTVEMSKPSHWTEKDALLMTYEEIEELNALAEIRAAGKHMRLLRHLYGRQNKQCSLTAVL